MRHIRLLTVAAVLAAVALFLPHRAVAQGQDWFVPGQQRGGPPGQTQRPGAGRAERAIRPQAPPVAMPAPFAAEPEAPSPPPAQFQVQLPPAPDVPTLPKGTPPPPPVIGVLGLGDISRASLAAQQVDKTLGERMTKLHDDAQKEQAAWRDIQQQLATQRNGLSADQIRAKERDLQERVTNAQRQFRDRNRVIQEAAQYARAQIERTLQQVVVQVATSRGINLVLHKEEVVLNYGDFDITEAVAQQLNKILPTVIVPADGVEVSQMPGAVPVAAHAQPGAPTAAAAAAAAQAPNAPPPAPATASPPAAPTAAGPRVTPAGPLKRP